MIKNKVFSFFAVLLIIAGTLAGCNNTENTQGGNNQGDNNQSNTRKEEVVKLVAATINPNDALLTQALTALSKEIEEQSDGTIKIDVHAGGTLGNASSLYQSVIAGDIDIIYSDSGWFAEHNPEFNTLGTNYLFKDQEHFESIVNTKGKFSYFEDLLIKNPGLKTIMYAGGLERNIISTFPINSADDLKGKAMRSGTGTAELEWWKNLGANPTTIDFNEVYTALQTNVTNGSQNSLDAMIEQRFGEVAKYVARTQHNLSLGFIVMNNDRYESLSQEQKDAIAKAAENVQAEYISKAFKKAEEDMEVLKSEFGVEFTNPDREKFIEISRIQLNELAEEYGIEDIIEEIFN